MKFSFLKSKVFISTTILLISIIAILSFSYYTLSMFTYSSDREFYGRKQSDLAAEIRQELLRRTDIEQIKFKSQDDFDLAGFFIKRANPKANLLLCHGYKGSKEFMYGYIEMFPDYNIFLFDFRAHGESSGSVISLGCHEYKDTIAAAHYIQEKSKSRDGKKMPLILLGISMGGASSLKAAEMDATICDAMIIDSTFAELKTMFTRGFALKTGLPYYPFLPVVQTMFHHVAQCDMTSMSPVDSVKKINQPIFFIHSCNDSLIRPENSLHLYTAARHTQTKLWIGPKCRHGWLHTYFTEIYKQKVNKFLQDTVFSAPLTQKIS